MLSIAFFTVFCLLVTPLVYAQTDLANVLWRDDFSTCTSSSGCTPNTNYWVTSVGTPANSEVQTWATANCKVNNAGQLVLSAIYKNNAWTSCQIQTKGSAMWAIEALSYNEIEFSAVIKMPTFTGAWPAFWMMGSNGKGWPLNGELDVMEVYNYRTGQESGYANSQTLFAGIHYLCGGETAASSCAGGNYWACACSGGGGTLLCGTTASPCYWPDGQHTFSLIINKSAKTITWLLDGNAYHTLNAAAADYDAFFDKTNPLYLIFDLALGGTGAGNVVQTSPTTEQLLVYDVRVTAQ